MHVERIYGLCNKLLGTNYEAEDACQEAFIKAWKKLATFNEQASFATWLYRIASNECIDRLRQRARWNNEKDEQAASGDDDNTQIHVCLNDKQIGIDRALTSLSDKTRAVIVLHDILGYSHEEISAKTGIAASTSRAHLHRAKKYLRALL